MNIDICPVCEMNMLLACTCDYPTYINALRDAQAKLDSLKRENEELRQALDEIGVTPAEAKAGVARSNALRKENEELKAEIERSAGILADLQREVEYKSTLLQSYDERDKQQVVLIGRYKAALEKLATCEDDSSWGDWVREMSREALDVYKV